jgi:hypothetical protein
MRKEESHGQTDPNQEHGLTILNRRHFLVARMGVIAMLSLESGTPSGEKISSNNSDGQERYGADCAMGCGSQLTCIG